MTGVRAALRDTQFFKRVYIDGGAVTWPGDIDLAPDAMHAQIARDGLSGNGIIMGYGGRPRAD
jgi:hypothetical protein